MIELPWIFWLLLIIIFFLILWFLTSSSSPKASIPPEGISEEEIKNAAFRFRSRKETICCLALEKIYGKPFSTVRPSFLKNPETNRNLEIDCYNEELKLGVEFNGYQHYNWPNAFHKTEEEFLQQLRRDQFKKRRCEEEKVYLIIVPDSVKESEITKYIWNRLPEIVSGG